MSTATYTIDLSAVDGPIVATVTTANTTTAIGAFATSADSSRAHYLGRSIRVMGTKSFPMFSVADVLGALGVTVLEPIIYRIPRDHMLIYMSSGYAVSLEGLDDIAAIVNTDDARALRQQLRTTYAPAEPTVMTSPVATKLAREATELTRQATSTPPQQHDREHDHTACVDRLCALMDRTTTMLESLTTMIERLTTAIEARQAEPMAVSSTEDFTVCVARVERFPPSSGEFMDDYIARFTRAYGAVNEALLYNAVAHHGYTTSTTLNGRIRWQLPSE